VGVLVLIGGLIMEVIDTVRTTKRPFVEHLDRTRELLPNEGDLLKLIRGPGKSIG
jgi:hypothetical protein